MPSAASWHRSRTASDNSSPAGGPWLYRGSEHHLYHCTKDIRLTQRFARHKSILTTSIYAHPSDEDLVRAVRELPR